MSLPRRLPPVEPEPQLLALFREMDHIPLAVRRQADFFVFFARTIFPVLERYRDRLATVYCAEDGRRGIRSVFLAFWSCSLCYACRTARLPRRCSTISAGAWPCT